MSRRPKRLRGFLNPFFRQFAFYRLLREYDRIWSATLVAIPVCREECCVVCIKAGKIHVAGPRQIARSGRSAILLRSTGL